MKGFALACGLAMDVYSFQANAIPVLQQNCMEEFHTLKECRAAIARVRAAIPRLRIEYPTLATGDAFDPAQLKCNYGEWDTGTGLPKKKCSLLLNDPNDPCKGNQ